MSMSIEIRCTPTTLREAEIAKEVIAAARGAVQAHSGTLSDAVHEHKVSTHDGGLTWTDWGLNLVASGYVHGDGAPVPAVKQVTRE